MKDIALDGARFTYLDEGQGIPVLLAHCSLAYSGLWSRMIAELDPGFRTIAPDLPAHGQSDRGDETITLQLQAVRMCEAIIEEVGGPVHLVGLSLGAAILGRLAIARPDLVRSLTLIEPIYFFLLRDRETAKQVIGELIAEDFGDALDRGDHESAVRGFMDYWGMRGRFDRMSQEVRDATVETFRHIAADLPYVHQYPPGQITPDQIGSLPMPVLLIEGVETDPNMTKVMDDLSGLLPGARRVTIEKAGHMAPVTHPAEVAAEVSAFLKAVELEEASA